MEEKLEKTCPRCGKPSKDKSNPSGRCSACLAKLRTAKATPGTYQQLHATADEALRRQDGRASTASAHSKGKGTRAELISKQKQAYKKYGKGQKLSPDRKDNDKGYASENIRMVPKKLNRGRHKVDPKKLRQWKEKVEKNELSQQDTVELLKFMLEKMKEKLSK